MNTKWIWLRPSAMGGNAILQENPCPCLPRSPYLSSFMYVPVKKHFECKLSTYTTSQKYSARNTPIPYLPNGLSFGSFGFNFCNKPFFAGATCVVPDAMPCSRSGVAARPGGAPAGGAIHCWSTSGVADLPGGGPAGGAIHSCDELAFEAPCGTP